MNSTTYYEHPTAVLQEYLGLIGIDNQKLARAPSISLALKDNQRLYLENGSNGLQMSLCVKVHTYDLPGLLETSLLACHYSQHLPFDIFPAVKGDSELVYCTVIRPIELTANEIYQRQNRLLKMARQVME